MTESISPTVMQDVNGTPFRPHHQRVVERLVEQFHDDPRFPALIIGGSLVKGVAREDSDVDIMLLATDEEYVRREALDGGLWYYDKELCDYEGGYIDGKILNRQFFLDAADHGSEPARAAFVGAIVPYSRQPGFAELVASIPVYPEDEREIKMQRFYSQIMLLTWFVGEAERHRNPYLMMRMAADLVLYAGRLILAYNRILYPYHKWFLTELRRAPNKPDDLMARIDALLDQPCLANAEALRDCVVNYREWGVSYPESVKNFMLDREWNWRYGTPPLEDW